MALISWELIAPITGIISIVLAFVTLKQVTKAELGNEKMQKASGLIEKGSKTFMKRQYTTLPIKNNDFLLNYVRIKYLQISSKRIK